MCWLLLIVVALTCVIVGWLAQSWKKQIGVLWGMLTLFVELASFLVLYMLPAGRRALFLAQAGQGIARLRAFRVRSALAIVVALGVGLVMVLVVALVPGPDEGDIQGN